jgi:hypothetical protein
MPGRDSAWRQGDLLIETDARALEIPFGEDVQRRVVVVSHDCDLANDKEPVVECIIADVVDQIDPSLARARNVRRLHLAYTTEDGQQLVLELRHNAWHEVPTERFDEVAERPDAPIELHADEKRALKQWLAARYGRPAFPNAFENRLRKKHRGKTVEYLTGKILEPHNEHLVGVFFDLDAARSIDLNEGNPYFLRIAIAYDASEGGREARLAAEEVAKEITELFESVYGKAGEAKEIALESCVAVADTHLTLADLRRIDQWRVEYISLRAEPAGEFLATGGTPV